MINFNYIIDKEVILYNYLGRLPKKSNPTEDEKKLLELLSNHLENRFGFKEEFERNRKVRKFFYYLEKADDKEVELAKWEIDGVNKETFQALLERIYNSSQMEEEVEKAEENKRILEAEWESARSFVSNYMAQTIGFSDDVIIDAFVTSGQTGGYAPAGKNRIFVGAGNISSENIIYLLHEAMHANILPYSDEMNREEIDNVHALIQYLADKELNYRLTGESFASKGSLPHLQSNMEDMYPFFLGYLYRNETNPELKLQQAILRDEQATKSYPPDIVAVSGINKIDFQSLDYRKIAEFFKDKKDMSIYDFLKIDFSKGKQIFLKEAKQQDEIEDETR